MFGPLRLIQSVMVGAKDLAGDVGRYHSGTAVQQCFFESQVINVINFMSPEPTTREAEVTESSTSQLTSFCQLNVLLLSCRNDKDFEFLLLTFSKLSPFISSVVSCSNLDTEKLSGW